MTPEDRIRELEGELERLRSEIQTSVDHHRYVLDNIPDYAVCLISSKGFIRSWNLGAERLEGYNEKEIIGQHFSIFFREEDRAEGKPERFLAHAAEKGNLLEEAWRRRRDGSLFWADVSLKALRDREGRVEGYTQVVRDVTHRRHYEVGLKQSEGRLKAVLQSASQGIVGMDGLGVIRLANPMAEQMFGYGPGELIGLPLSTLIPERIRERHDSHLAIYMKSPKTRPMGAGLELTGLHRDGSEIPVEVSLSYTEAPEMQLAVAFVSDISQRKKQEAALREIEAQLRQSQKVEAIGQLVSGVAHDFNNILTVINGRASLMRGDEQLPDDALVQLDEIIGAGERAASLTRRLLAFGRKQSHQVRTIEINQVLSGLLSLLRRVLRADIEVEMDLDPELPPIRADQIHIEQIILNLVINAQDAMPESGRLSIRTWSDSTRSQVMLSIADTGLGIPENIRDRIFEPFFTTKDASRGTGLGLSTVHAIVNQLGGQITVESVAGLGSIFTMYFPAATPEPAAPVVPLPVRWAPRGSILVVEDDPAVRLYVESALAQQGYLVQGASDGLLALEAALESTPVDLLLADVVLPGMSGHRLAERLRDYLPSLKVVFMSGYSESIVMPEPGMNSQFLSKPFNVDMLLEKVHRALSV